MRPTKLEYYLNIARVVATRGTCLRRNFGAVIVKDDQIVGTGYTGAPRGSANCCDLSFCERDRLNIKPGERYELCRSVHAEMNAILHAGRGRCIGASMYLVGVDCITGKDASRKPCDLCIRMIINSGIVEVQIPGHNFII